ncbi:MAG: hypothetical protein ACKVW3_06020 [Phycisphaerales bacterium]
MSDIGNRWRRLTSVPAHGATGRLIIVAASVIAVLAAAGCYRKVVSARGIVPPGVKIEEPNNPESRQRSTQRPAPASRNTPMRPMKPMN